MHEAQFVRTNAEKWKRFERQLRAQETDPEILADLYVSLTDDLAYARTHFPEGEAVQYLNNLTAEVHQAVYRERREDRGRIARFFGQEVPKAVGKAQTELLAGALIFLLAAGIGVLSALSDPGFTRLILGDTYVNMTLQNIQEGEPMAVYQQVRALDMFLGVAFNNIRVAFLTFAMGLLVSVGTAFMLVQNGIMIGVFHTLFYEHGLLAKSLLVVYVHGTLEISAIIIAGAAGLVLGNGLLFPGTFPRRTAFVRAARQGSKIVVGLVPIFLLAAFLEGFVTRHSTLPAIVPLSIIVGSLALLVWYFLIRPRRLLNE